MTNVSKRYFSLSFVCDRGAPRGSAPDGPSPSLRPVGARRAPDLVDRGEALADLVDLLLGVGPVRVVRDAADARGRRDRVVAVGALVVGHRAGEVPGVRAAVVEPPAVEGGGGVAVSAGRQGRLGHRAGQPRQRGGLGPGHRRTVGDGAGAVVDADGELDRAADVAGEGVDDRVAQGPLDGLLGELARRGQERGVVEQAERAGDAHPGALLRGDGRAVGCSGGELGDHPRPRLVEVGELVRHTDLLRPDPAHPNPRTVRASPPWARGSTGLSTTVHDAHER
jgi:hypothetical protein